MKELDENMVALILINQGASKSELDEILDRAKAVPVHAPIGAWLFNQLVQVRTERHNAAMKAVTEQDNG